MILICGVAAFAVSSKRIEAVNMRTIASAR